MRIGEIDVTPLSDGTFVAGPGYFHVNARAEEHSEMFDRHGKAWLPIGCFIVRTADRLILVDAGIGPMEWVNDERCRLIGGQLLVGLRALGIDPSTITDVILTHLHNDHVGWLYDLQGDPIFTSAHVWLGAGDWHLFVSNPPINYIQDHIVRGLRGAGTRGERVTALDQDLTVAPGVDILLTPGHTPGHLSVVLSSGDQRMLILGDAITCPIQLSEPDWHSMGDVDPKLADRTRERLWRELEGDNVIGAGAHFPELKFGRVLNASGRRYWS